MALIEVTLRPVEAPYNPFPSDPYSLDPTAVVCDNPWADDDDATYVDLTADPYLTGGVSTAAKSVAFALLPAVPDITELVDWRIQWRAEYLGDYPAPGGGDDLAPFQLLFAAGNAAGDLANNEGAPVVYGAAEYGTNDYDWASMSSLDVSGLMTAGLAAGTWGVMCRYSAFNPDGFDGGNWRVYEVSLELKYNASTGAKPYYCRIHPGLQ